MGIDAVTNVVRFADVRTFHPALPSGSLCYGRPRGLRSARVTGAVSCPVEQVWHFTGHRLSWETGGRERDTRLAKDTKGHDLFRPRG